MSDLDGHRRSIAAGAVMVALYQLCFFSGTTRTGVALATVVALGSAPVFAGLIDSAVLRRLPTTRWVTGTGLAIVGMGLIARCQPAARTDLSGILASLAAGMAWAVYARIGEQRIRAGLDSTTCMAAMFTGGAILSLPLLATGNIGWIVTRHGMTLSLYLGIVTVGVVYTCFGWGLRRLPAPTVVTLTLAEPMTAAVLATVLLHQRIGVAGWIGVAGVLVALMITAGSPMTTDVPIAASGLEQDSVAQCHLLTVAEIERVKDDGGRGNVGPAALSRLRSVIADLLDLDV